MGGGGSGGPSQQTITQSNIPEWLRPQVEGMIGAATQELFKTQQNPETGKYEITGTKPFTPFSESGEDYFAKFNPQQQAVFGEVAGLRSPLEGAGLSGRAANVGQQYMQSATDPNAIKSFMSPYMQNVVDVQQQQAQRQADIAAQAQKAQYGQAGAFGGGRSAIGASQGLADLARQKNMIQATGLQNAFQNAQQAQQFGSTLGLQGLQAAGALGAQEFADTRSRLGMQADMGALQRQREQDVINQNIQTYGTKQQYPLQMLNAYNALLRGYAVPGQSATTYSAAPSLTNQLVGLGGAAYMGSKAFGAEGGKVDSDNGIAGLGLYNAMKKGS
jgi:hypothetical protein